jgi:hypothetical protein
MSPPDCLAKPKTGALPYFLGREKRLKDPMNLLWRDPLSGVGEGDGDEPTWNGWPETERGDFICGPDLQGQPTLTVHRIARVHGHVDDRRIELTGVDIDK